MTKAEVRMTNGDRAIFDVFRVSSFLLCFCCACLLAPDLHASEADMLPRYRLEVGQELVYKLVQSEDPRASNGAKDDEGQAAAHDQMEWRIVVARQNIDGSWRLYIRTRVRFVDRDGSVRGKHESLGYCDLHPNGSYSLDEQTATFKKLFPYQLFCRLPDDLAALNDKWKYEAPVHGRLLNFNLAKRDGAHLHMAGIQQDVYSQVNKWQIAYTYAFDTQRGLVVSIADEWKDLVTDQVKQGKTVRLTSSARRDSAWATQFHKEAQKYLVANAKWMTGCYEGLRARTAEACKAARVNARALLVAGREQAELDDLRELYDADIETHDKDDQWMVDSVKKREQFFAAAPEFPANWEAKNLDGSTFRLADHRGKVLVLYFWSTSCEYCVLAAPQIRRLAGEYQGKNVGVVGMFVSQEFADDEETRAKYMIARCYQGFPNLEAKDIPALYRLQEFGLGGSPSILVLDQAGKVHEVSVGYAADLAQHCKKIVDGLLSKPPG